MTALPDFLSCFPDKLKIYSQDLHFLAGWTTLIRLQERYRFSPERLWTLGSVLLKADALLRDNGSRAIRYLQSHGYQIITTRPIKFNSDLVLDLWQYSLGRLSPQRVILLQRLQQTCYSLYMVVQAPKNCDHLPGSLRLTELKGQAILTNRKLETLRSAMGNPQSAFFNFVHTADEPADLVREFGLLFDNAQREILLNDIMLNEPQDSELVFQNLSSCCPKSDLDFRRAIRRIKLQLTSTPLYRRNRYVECFDKLRSTGLSGWQSLRAQLEQANFLIDDLDEMAILGELIELKQQSPTQPFPSCETRHWADHKPIRPYYF